MRIVEFEDGTYGIVNTEGDAFADLKTSTIFWWSKHSEFFKDCKGTLEEAKEAYKRYESKNDSLTSKIKRYL